MRPDDWANADAATWRYFGAIRGAYNQGAAYSAQEIEAKRDLERETKGV